MIAWRTHPRLRVVLLVGLLAAAIAVYVFRAEIVRALLVAGAGAAAWRILLSQAGMRRVTPRRHGGKSWLAGWVEALSVAWIAAHVTPARREKRPRRGADGLQPVYGGRDELGGRRRPPPGPGPSDEIPF